ncbi:hypothetical protein PGTUg99_020075 [Puccinia graminis f. sp. tritici]|uniref:Uncharacterized protein n=1 Tax=Puccinia graminis f. sp. tritici TaxID=56615 RepID=A0A5B0RIP0_PUCGR|nr:hypothetical protein PGTUg99_020075 [Puccinia graminis f. sp. tritici]
MVTPADILIPPSHLAAPAPRPRLASRTSFSSAYYHPLTHTRLIDYRKVILLGYPVGLSQAFQAPADLQLPPFAPSSSKRPRPSIQTLTSASKSNRNPHPRPRNRTPHRPPPSSFFSAGADSAHPSACPPTPAEQTKHRAPSSSFSSADIESAIRFSSPPHTGRANKAPGPLLGFLFSRHRIGDSIQLADIDSAI